MLDFQSITRQFKERGSAPHVEFVEEIRRRFPGDGHAFDPLIEELGPLANGHLAMPDLNDHGRTQQFRDWLYEVRRGNQKYLKPILFRWLWRKDEPWMRAFLYRWEIEPIWTPDSLPEEGADDVAALLPDIVLGYVEGADLTELRDVSAILKAEGCRVSFQRIAAQSRDSATLRDAECEAASVVAFYWGIEARKLHQIDTYVAEQVTRLVADRTKVLAIRNGIDPVDWWKFPSLLKIPYTNMRFGAEPVARELSMALQRAKAGPDSLAKYRLSLIEKNTGREFLQTDFHRELKKWGPQATLAIFDIDGLTQINRKFGSELGDRVIDVVLSIIMNALDPTVSSSGRCGDDAFYAVIYSEYKQKKAFDDIIAAVKIYDWKQEAHELRVTCSAGYAMRRENEVGVDVAIRAAMGIKYAKADGGNNLKEGPPRISNATSRYIHTHFS